LRLKFLITLSFVSLIFVGVLLALLSYSVNQVSEFNFFEGSSSFIFWLAIVSLAFLFPLRKVGSLFVRYVRTLKGAAIFGSYLTVHLILYGLLLEGIIAFSKKLPPFVNQFYASIASIPIYPVSASSILIGFAFNPSIDIFVPPVFVIALSFYTLCISFIIAVLVLTNIMKVLEIGKICGSAIKSRNLVLLPTLGVVGGAACCLSLPILISLSIPTAAVLSNSPIVWYSAYFLFPSLTAVGLKLNMDSTMRLATKLSRAVATKKSLSGASQFPK
jgi:hypothetical protein